MQATAMQTPGGAAAALSGWTFVILIVMALGAVLVIAGMIYGNRLARQRHRALEAAEERAEEAGVEPVPAPSSAIEDPSQAQLKEKDPAERAVEQAAPTPPAPQEPLAPPPLPTETAEPAPEPAAFAAPVKPSEPAAPPPAPPVGDAPAIEPAIAGALALTTIKGLGPKVAALLAEQGITRVDQIAALSDAEAEALDARLGAFTGRMARDRWIDQAKLLASGDTAAYEAEFGKLG